MGFQPNWQVLQPENKWRILRKQTRFALWAIYSSIGGMMLGYDFVVGGTVAAYPAFQEEFGGRDPSQPSGYLIPADYLSGWGGASAGGLVVGAVIAGQLMECIGRRYTVLVGSIVTAIGVAIQVASAEWRLFLGGRLVNGVGFGMVSVEGPVWIGENVRPELRGFFLCLANGSIVFGQFLLACIGRGTSELTGYWSFETLLVFQFFFCVVIWLFFPWYPESPFYLLMKGNHDEARRALGQLHGSRDQSLVGAELARLQSVVSFSEEIRRAARAKGPLLMQCFQGSNLKRSVIAILAAAGQQFIGAAFVLGYITYFLALIGVTEYFTVSLVLFIVMLLANLSAFVCIETGGRRVLLVPGMIILTSVLLIMGIMGCLSSDAALWVVVVCVFVWAITYQLTIGAVGFAIGAEIASPPLRPSVQSLIGLVQGAAGWLFSFVTPYMINPDAGNLGAKVGFVYAGLGIPFCIAFWFLIPETKGLSFDELDYLFNNRTSCRRFQTTIMTHRARNGEPLVVEVKGDVLKAEGATTTQAEIPSSPVLV